MLDPIGFLVVWKNIVGDDFLILKSTVKQLVGLSLNRKKNAIWFFNFSSYKHFDFVSLFCLNLIVFFCEKESLQILKIYKYLSICSLLLNILSCNLI